MYEAETAPSGRRVDADSSITLQAARVARVLAGIVGGLAVLHLLTLAFRYMGHGRVLGFVPEFDVGRENNVPTWAASIMHFLAAMLLGCIFILKRKARDAFARHWGVLAALFIYISMDEVVGLRERTIDPLQALLNTSGALRAAWVIPALILLPIFVAMYTRFLLHLPARTRNLIVLAGAVFVAGAIGFEMLGVRYRFIYAEGERNITYGLFQAVEETLEMAGVVLFIYALLGYIRHRLGPVQVRFEA